MTSDTTAIVASRPTENQSASMSNLNLPDGNKTVTFYKAIETRNAAYKGKTKKKKATPVESVLPEPTAKKILTITSSAFKSNDMIPPKYTCDGQGTTPPISIGNIPGGTRSFVLIVHDYEATPKAGFTHWIIWNIDTTGYIPEGFINDHESINAAKQYGYAPICPKSGTHKYHFTVYALDVKLVLDKNTTKQSIENVMRPHVLAKGDLAGTYNHDVRQ